MTDCILDLETAPSWLYKAYRRSQKPKPKYIITWPGTTLYLYPGQLFDNKPEQGRYDRN